MNKTISDETLEKLNKAAYSTKFRTFVQSIVSKRYKSVNYLSSDTVCNAVTLNLLLNSEITPHSADPIISHFAKSHKSIYSTVSSAFYPIEERFEQYAKEILGDEYQSVKQMNLSIIEYVVYVISLEVESTSPFSPKEIYFTAYSYQERLEKRFPHY